MVKKSILFVTGTRADFGKLEPLALAAKDAGFLVTFFVTGMHMLEKYGLTKKEVHSSGAGEVVEFVNQRHGDPQDIVMAKTIVGFSDLLQEKNPDMVVIHGDRIEALACALVCATNGKLCAHVEGGEVSGTIDEMLRHCNTKLSTIHLVSSEAAKQRVLRLGEAPNSVEIIGSPELDIHCGPSGVSIEEVFDRYAIESDNYGICIFHPVTTEISSIGAQAQSLFGALRKSGRYFVVILPNNDPGADDILQEIQGLKCDQFRVLPSMRFRYFSELLRNSKAIVGNSSSGVREAPFLGVPSIDLGTRQTNRASAVSITAASPFDQAAIMKFLTKEWGKRYESSLDFGAGSAANRFYELITADDFWTRSMQKHFAE